VASFGTGLHVKTPFSGLKKKLTPSGNTNRLGRGVLARPSHQRGLELGELPSPHFELLRCAHTATLQIETAFVGEYRRVSVAGDREIIMIRHIGTATAFVLCLLAVSARAQTLPLPDNLIDMRSDRGEQLLRGSDALEAFVPLSINFVTQKNQAFCGVASIVMVLNALQLPAPAVPEYDPYRTFTQDNFLNEKTETILPQDVLAKLGMTLDQLGELLATQPVEVQLHHAADVHRSDRLAPA
jgi:Phytochelatin synthase